MTQSSREKQADYRARMALLGLSEVRGIYLPPELHAALKEHAAKMLAKYKPPGNGDGATPNLTP